MLALLLLSRENRWSSKSHHACMFGRVATEVNTVKIRPMGQMIWRFISKPDTNEDTEAPMTGYQVSGAISFYSYLWGTGIHTQMLFPVTMTSTGMLPMEEGTGKD
jgi:hypothetical protein